MLHGTIRGEWQSQEIKGKVWQRRATPILPIKKARSQSRH
jgi:hypothetical protein